MSVERVFVIGASSGVAKIITEGLSQSAEIILISRKKIEPMKGVKALLVEEYSEDSIKNIINSMDRSKSTAVIFCNGIADSDIFYKISNNEIDHVMRVNFIDPLVITKTFLRLMQLDEVRFIYLSSSRAELNDPGITLYAASKAALTAASKSLSLEYGRTKKYFFIISLGLLETGLINKISNEKIAYLKQRSAINKFIDPAEIQIVINFLFSNNSMTGSVVHCDNGYH
jgi:NAD(P)-dependent dehydrogenase (short-subunit alcohol dehydrogenase family)